MVRREEAKRVQTVRFDTTHERVKSLVRLESASACPSASSAGSPRFCRPLPRRQRPAARCALGGPHSTSGGSEHGNTLGPYGSLADGDSAYANDAVPRSLWPPRGAHRGALSSTSLHVPDPSVFLHHRLLPARHREAPPRDKNRAPRYRTATSHQDNSSWLVPQRLL